MWEEAVFNRIVLLAVGRVMGDADCDPNFICQLLQVLLENVVARTVTPAAVAENEDGRGVGIVLRP